MNLKLRSARHRANEAALAHSPDEVCLGKAFILIERHPLLFPPPALRKGIFFPNLFPRALSRQGLFHSTLFAWLQVMRVAFHFSNDVFRKNFTFESAKRILYGFALLHSNFCHLSPSHQIIAIQVSYKRRFVSSICLSRRQFPPNPENKSYSPA